MASLLVSILVTPEYLDFLQEDEYGFVILFTQLVAYTSVLDFGIGSWLLQKISVGLISASDQTDAIIKKSYRVLFLVLIVSLPIIAIIAFKTDLFFSLPAGHAFSKTLFFFALLASVVSIFFKPFTSIQVAKEHLRTNATISFFSLLIFNVGSLVLLHIGWGINSFFLAHITSVIINLSASSYFLKKQKSFALHIGIPTLSETQTVLSGSFFIFLNAVSAQIIYNGDRIILAGFVSLSSLSIFSLNIRVLEIGQTALIKMTDTFMPKMIKAANLGVDFCYTYFFHISRLTAVAAILILANIFLFNQTFITLWIGPEWIMPSSEALTASYGLAVFLHVVFRIPSIFLFGLGKNEGYTKTSFADAILNLTLSILLIPEMGVMGAVTATVISTLITSVPANIYLLKNSLHKSRSFWHIIQPGLLPLAKSAPLIGASLWASSAISAFADSWLRFVFATILLNLIIIPVTVMINFGGLKNLQKEINQLNHGFHG